MSADQKPVIAIVGPTASGKSTLGIEIALELNGEIINCDSVQVYQEIEIATAKVPIEERKGVPHHLIGFVPPQINYTAGEWARAAADKIDGMAAAVNALKEYLDHKAEEIVIDGPLMGGGEPA